MRILAPHWIGIIFNICLNYVKLAFVSYTIYFLTNQIRFMLKKLSLVFLAVISWGCEQKIEPSKVEYGGENYLAIQIPNLLPIFVQDIKSQEFTPAYALTEDSLVKWDYNSSNVEKMEESTNFWKKNGSILLVDSDENFNLNRDVLTGKRSPALSEVVFSGSMDSENTDTGTRHWSDLQIEIVAVQTENIEGEFDIASEMNKYLEENGAIWEESEQQEGTYETITKGKVTIDNIEFNLNMHNYTGPKAVVDTFIFNFQVSPSSEDEIENDEVLNSVQEDNNSQSNVALSKPKIEHKALNYGEVRGTILGSDLSELKDVLGKPDGTWSRNMLEIYLYYFKAEKFGTIGHIRVTYNFSSGKVATVDFFEPGDQIKVSPIQYVNSPLKP